VIDNGYTDAIAARKVMGISDDRGGLGENKPSADAARRYSRRNSYLFTTEA